MTREPFSEAAHRAYGSQLKRMDAELLQLRQDVQASYGATDPLIDRLDSISDTLLRVRADLETRVVNEHDPLDWSKIYLSR